MREKRPALAERLQEFSRRRVQLVRRMALMRGGWVFLWLALLLIVVDVSWPLPTAARLWLDYALLATLPGCFLITFFHQSRGARRQKHIARLIENGSPQLDNHLINALEFDDALRGGASAPGSPALMRREIDDAAALLEPLQISAGLLPAHYYRDRRLLRGSAGGSFALLLIFFPVFSAVVPRYVDPYGDHPPYTAIRCKIDPGNVTVEYGGSLRVEVEFLKHEPQSAQLAVSGDDGAVTRIPLHNLEEAKYFQVLENIDRELSYYIEYPRSRSRKFRIALSKTPRILAARATFHFPQYTRLEAETRQLREPFALKGYPRTEVELRIESNRPLEGGTIQAGETAHELRPGDNPKTALGRFPLAAPGPWRATVRDVEGTVSVDALEGAIELLEDQLPEIRITEPGKDAFATPDSEIGILIEAEDDLGLAQVALVRNFNGSIDFRKTVISGAGEQKYATIPEILDLAELGVQPGDVIEYYALAQDSCPNPPQFQATEAYRLRIISSREYQDFLRQQLTAEDLRRKYEELQDLLRELADAQRELRGETEKLNNRLAAGESPGAAERERLDELRQRQQELAEQARQLAAQLAEEAQKDAVFEIEESYKTALLQIAQDLTSATWHMQNSAQQLQAEGERAADPAGTAQPPNASAGRSLAAALQSQQAALDALGQGRQTFQQQIQEPNRQLEQLAKLMLNAQQFIQLYQQQEQLERQTRSLSQSPRLTPEQEAQLAQLGRRQRQVREELEQLQQELRQNAKEVEQEYPQVAQDACKIADEIESRMIPGTMRAAEGLIEERIAGAGHEQVNAAYEQMQAMISICDPQGGMPSQCEPRLRLNMMKRGLKAGGTLGQLARNMGLGRQFGMGMGNDGYYGSQADFSVYGNEMMRGRENNKTRWSGRKKANARMQKDRPDPLAGDVEELLVNKNEDLQAEQSSRDRFLTEYRSLLEAYFAPADEQARPATGPE